MLVDHFSLSSNSSAPSFRSWNNHAHPKHE